jgi:hypothetical protein
VRPQDQGNLSHPAPPITMSWVSDHIRIWTDNWIYWVLISCKYKLQHLHYST